MRPQDRAIERGVEVDVEVVRLGEVCLDEVAQPPDGGQGYRFLAFRRRLVPLG